MIVDVLSPLIVIALAVRLLGTRGMLSGGGMLRRVRSASAIGAAWCALLLHLLEMASDLGSIEQLFGISSGSGARLSLEGLSWTAFFGLLLAPRITLIVLAILSTFTTIIDVYASGTAAMIQLVGRVLIMTVAAVILRVAFGVRPQV